MSKQCIESEKLLQTAWEKLESTSTKKYIFVRTLDEKQTKICRPQETLTIDMRPLGNYCQKIS